MSHSSLRKVLIELERAGLRTEALVIEELFASLEQRADVEEVLRQILVGAEEISSQQEHLQASMAELIRLVRDRNDVEINRQAAEEKVALVEKQNQQERFRLRIEKLWAPALAAVFSLLTGLVAGAWFQQPPPPEDSAVELPQEGP